MRTPNKSTCPITSHHPRRSRGPRRSRCPSRLAVIVTIFVASHQYNAATLAQDSDKISTRDDRKALVEYLLEKTRQREAWSPVKNKRLGLDPLEEMQKYSAEIVDAKNETEFFYALARFSNARHDRHLSVRSRWHSPNNTKEFMKVLSRADVLSASARVPLALQVDFSDPQQPFLFVSRLADKAADLEINIGDKVVAVNGRKVSEFVEWAEPYFAWSTRENFWTLLARLVPTINPTLPPQFFETGLRLTLQHVDGTEYDVRLTYYVSRVLEWPLREKYPGFRKRMEFESFDVYLPESDSEVLLLDWYGFRKDLTSSVDELIQTADKEGWLDYDLVIDCLRSRGGSQGAYALSHFTWQPFKTTFGNLRLSDAAEVFVDRKLKQIAENDVEDAGVPETLDRGQWLKAWLMEDVQPALKRGDDYSNNVPFKCAHLPKDSDGMMQPADKHFRGNLVCWFSPYGGSHLDQFAAMVVDNRLGWTVGMSTGGYSNTWEYTEDVKFPETEKLAIRFMWTIGHTIRPNGEILEGNPAEVERFFPMTRENYSTYRAQLLELSLKHLEGK